MLRLLAVAAGVLVVCSGGAAYMASNTVGPSSAGQAVVVVPSTAFCPLTATTTAGVWREAPALTANAGTLGGGC